jgi:HPt (histidine-containing phosphotransfer) domain-containing protein
MFCRDARTRLPLLEKRPEEGERKVFTTQMHALKSALASIGATDLATVAANLEEAGRSGDMSAIHDTLYVFHNALESLLKRIDAALSQARPADDRPGGERRVEKERELLAQLKDALEQEDIDAMDKALEALKALSLASDMRDALSSIAECMLSADFTKAATELEIFLRREA